VLVRLMCVPHARQPREGSESRLARGRSTVLGPGVRQMVPEAAETPFLIRRRRASLKLDLDPGQCDAAHLSTDRDLPCSIDVWLTKRLHVHTLATRSTTWIQVHPTTPLQSTPACPTRAPARPVPGSTCNLSGPSQRRSLLSAPKPCMEQNFRRASSRHWLGRLGPHILTGFSRLRLTCLLFRRCKALGCQDGRRVGFLGGKWAEKSINRCCADL
jgi:hypothetical protein